MTPCTAGGGAGSARGQPIEGRAIRVRGAEFLRQPRQELKAAAGRLAAEGAAAVVVDCETSYIRLGLATELASQLGAPVVRLEQLRADYLAQAVRRAAGDQD